MAQNIVFNEEQKKEVEKELALLALQLLEDAVFTPTRSQEFSEYLLDNLEFLEDTEDMLDMLVEIHDDWGVKNKMLADLLEKYIKMVESNESAVEDKTAADTEAQHEVQHPTISATPVDQEKVEDIKSKLASLANLS